MTEQRYAVTANRLNLRREPGLEAQVLAVLEKGQTVLADTQAGDSWWKVRTEAAGQEGYASRRYLAPLSAGPPAIPAEANAALWRATEAAAGHVTYKLGDKHSSQGRIDCSGWVGEITTAAFDAVNAAAAPEAVFDRADYGVLATHSDGIVSQIEGRTGFVLHGEAVTAAALREGMLIGCNFGDYTWEMGSPPRVYGIDHIVQVVRHPETGELWITQSSSSGGGVNRLALAGWLQGAAAALIPQRRIHAVDPFRMADRNTSYLGLVANLQSVAAGAPPAPAAPAAPAPADPSSPVAPPAPAAPPTGAVVTDAASALIVDFETGGRALYEKLYTHPTWPKGQSGVTIGIGHDLGYTTPADFDRNWAALPADSRARLSATIGKTGAAAQACIPGLRDIVVPWVIAEAVYKAVDIPEFAHKTANAVPNCDRLPGDCFGVLVSLSFNRGASYGNARKPGDGIDRFKEMRAIKAAMAAGTFNLIPAQIRSMKRIWANTPNANGLSRRREAEAVMFEKALAAQRAQPVQGDAEEAAPPAGSGISTATSDETWANTTVEEAIVKAAAAPTDDVDQQADLVARSQVVWASDNRSIDYAHLAALPTPGTRFTLRAADLERLARLNAFPVGEVDANPILFGLRGCGVIDAGDSFAEEVVLLDRRPDHHSARCVIGVWDRAKGRIAVFPGSTVPNAKAVTSWFKTHEAGNMLPTGLYRYVTGTHNGKPGCFLLRKADGSPRTVVVRRSSNDLRYDRADLVDRCTPGDNIHPTFFRTPDDFSSVGCQVIVGSASPAGDHVGPWSVFRALAGLAKRGAPDGRPYGYMLLTGAEACIASGLRRAGTIEDSADWQVLRRLRFGSSGPDVQRLQTQLQIAGPDGDFGPETSVRLHAAQRTHFEDACDGIYSEATDEAFGWQVLG